MHTSYTDEAMKTRAKWWKLPDQATFGGSHVIETRQNKQWGQGHRSYQPANWPLSSLRLTSCFMLPPNMTFYVNQLHINFKSRLILALVTFFFLIKPTDQPIRAKSSTDCHCLLDCLLASLSMDGNTITQEHLLYTGLAKNKQEMYLN